MNFAPDRKTEERPFDCISCHADTARQKKRAPTPRRICELPPFAKSAKGEAPATLSVRVLFGEKREPSSEFRLLFAESVTTPYRTKVKC